MTTRGILIVDDEDNIRRMMRIALEAEGYQVDEAPDGETALDLFADGSRYDAVVLDEKMPGMDGIATMREMLKRSPNAAIIMVTAFGSIDLAVHALKGGARDFLRKPLTPALLRDALAAALSTRQQAARAPAQTLERPPTPPVSSDQELWTVNGFFIKALPPSEAARPNEYRCAVRHALRGPQGEVVVSISTVEISRIEKLSGRPPMGRPFWQQQAERALMNHLLGEAALPFAGRLEVTKLSDDIALRAQEWSDV